MWEKETSFSCGCARHHPRHIPGTSLGHPWDTCLGVFFYCSFFAKAAENSSEGFPIAIGSCVQFGDAGISPEDLDQISGARVGMVRSYDPETKTYRVAVPLGYEATEENLEKYSITVPASEVRDLGVTMGLPDYGNPCLFPVPDVSQAMGKFLKDMEAMLVQYEEYSATLAGEEKMPSAVEGKVPEEERVRVIHLTEFPGAHSLRLFQADSLIYVDEKEEEGHHGRRSHGTATDTANLKHLRNSVCFSQKNLFLKLKEILEEDPKALVFSKTFQEDADRELNDVSEEELSSLESRVLGKDRIVESSYFSDRTLRGGLILFGQEKYRNVWENNFKQTQTRQELALAERLNQFVRSVGLSMGQKTVATSEQKKSFMETLFKSIEEKPWPKEVKQWAEDAQEVVASFSDEDYMTGKLVPHINLLEAKMSLSLLFHDREARILQRVNEEVAAHEGVKTVVVITEMLNYMERKWKAPKVGLRFPFKLEKISTVDEEIYRESFSSWRDAFHDVNHFVLDEPYSTTASEIFSLKTLAEAKIRIEKKRLLRQ